jgi:hypothetical protein
VGRGGREAAGRRSATQAAGATAGSRPGARRPPLTGRGSLWAALGGHDDVERRQAPAAAAARPPALRGLGARQGGAGWRWRRVMGWWPSALDEARQRAAVWDSTRARAPAAPFCRRLPSRRPHLRAHDVVALAALRPLLSQDGARVAAERGHLGGQGVGRGAADGSQRAGGRRPGHAGQGRLAEPCRPRVTMPSPPRPAHAPHRHLVDALQLLRHRVLLLVVRQQPVQVLRRLRARERLQLGAGGGRERGAAARRCGGVRGSGAGIQTGAHAWYGR